MNYKETLLLIDTSVSRINEGLSWEAFQSELKGMTGLYQKDIDAICRKVIKGLDDIHGQRIYAQLVDNPTKLEQGNLDDYVYERICIRQIGFVKNDLKNRIAKELLEGKSLKEAALAHMHPLLTENDVEQAFNKASHKVVSEQQNQLSPRVVFAIIGAVFTVIQILLLLT